MCITIILFVLLFDLLFLALVYGGTKNDYDDRFPPTGASPVTLQEGIEMDLVITILMLIGFVLNIICVCCIAYGTYYIRLEEKELYKTFYKQES